MPIVELHPDPKLEQEESTAFNEPAPLDAGDLEDILEAYTINPPLMRKVCARIDFLRASIRATLSDAAEVRGRVSEQAIAAAIRLEASGSKGGTITPKKVLRRSKKETAALADAVAQNEQALLSGASSSPNGQGRSRSKSTGGLRARIVRTLSSSRPGEGAGSPFQMSADQLLDLRTSAALFAEVDGLFEAVCPGVERPPLEKLNAIEQALQQQRNLAEYISSTPNYQAISLTANTLQKLAKILRLLEQKGRNVVTNSGGASANGAASATKTDNVTTSTDDAIASAIVAADTITPVQYDALKGFAKDWVEALIPDFEVEFLGGRNGIVAKFTPLAANLEGKSFVINLIILQRDFIKSGQTCLDARRNLFIKTHGSHATAGAGIFADSPRTTLFERFATPFYASRVPLDDIDTPAAASASDKPCYDGVNLSDICLDGVLCLQACEFIPGGDMAERYQNMHTEAKTKRINDARAMRVQIAKQAIKEGAEWVSFFGRLINQGFVFTDIKPQNVLSKLSDIKGLAKFKGKIREGFELPAMDISPTYSDRRVDARCYKPELALKIAIIALLYHCIAGEAPEYDHRTGKLQFQWDDHHPFAREAFEINRQSLGDFLAEHYAQDEGYAAFFAGLSAFDAKYNPTATAGEVVPGAAPTSHP